MAKAKSQTERLQVRSETTGILTFLVRRLTLRSDGRGANVRDTVTRTDIRDAKGQRLEETTPSRFRSPESGEEFFEDNNEGGL